ncbi:hypothetical protein FGLOB1_352 [Fusarium globosum]|uniref:Uncharacterized protein n=1 Tax=Fusarium globosum TaxID=78864 RepID=A0A8H5YZL8_9HYPO|nr:hypothetical protein FGLOB1_352 [Fusarium globosum]
MSTYSSDHQSAAPRVRRRAFDAAMTRLKSDHRPKEDPSREKDIKTCWDFNQQNDKIPLKNGHGPSKPSRSRGGGESATQHSKKGERSRLPKSDKYPDPAYEVARRLQKEPSLQEGIFNVLDKAGLVEMASILHELLDQTAADANMSKISLEDRLSGQDTAEVQKRLDREFEERKKWAMIFKEADDEVHRLGLVAVSKAVGLRFFSH